MSGPAASGRPWGVVTPRLCLRREDLLTGPTAFAMGGLERAPLTPVPLTPALCPRSAVASAPRAPQAPHPPPARLQLTASEPEKRPREPGPGAGGRSAAARVWWRGL